MIRQKLHQDCQKVNHELQNERTKSAISSSFGHVSSICSDKTLIRQDCLHAAHSHLPLGWVAQHRNTDIIVSQKLKNNHLICITMKLEKLQEKIQIQFIVNCLTISSSDWYQYLFLSLLL